MRRSTAQKGPVTPGPGRIPALLFAAVAALAVSGCDRRTEPVDATPAPAAAATPPVEAPRLPLTPTSPPLTRAEFLAAARQAAADFAAGRSPAQGDPLIGRTFAIRSAFACGGPSPAAASPAAPPEGVPTARWGAQSKTVELSLTPGDWIDSPSLAAPKAEGEWEAIEGFWLTRPWLDADACPAARRDPLQTATAAPSPQTVGLAVVYDKDASRLGRRNGRAFTYTVRGEGEAAATPPEAGYRVEMRGRILGFPGGRAFRCSAAGPDQRPTCVAAVALDDVLYMTADGQTLSQWRGG